MYWHLLSTLKRRLEAAHNVNVVFELNRWCLDGPNAHADAALSHPRLRKTVVRRLLADYIGVPITHLFSRAPLASLDASVRSLKSKVEGKMGADHDLTTVLLAHSLGGPLAYRYLQQYPNTAVNKVLSFGAMNHFTNPVLAGGKPFHPVPRPHLDVLDPSDFLAFPFYADPGSTQDLPEPDADHFTLWTSEPWLPVVFAHTVYAHAESFYEAAAEFCASVAETVQ